MDGESKLQTTYKKNQTVLLKEKYYTHGLWSTNANNQSLYFLMSVEIEEMESPLKKLSLINQ